MVLPRNAWRRLYQQRLVLLLTMLAFVWPLLCAGFIYLTNHAALLQGLEPEFRQFIQVDGGFFAIFMYVQAGFAVFLAALAGPSLVAPEPELGGREREQREPTFGGTDIGHDLVDDPGDDRRKDEILRVSRERAKELLRKRTPFVWDQTTLLRSKDVNGVANGYTTTWDFSFTSLK